MNGPVDFRDATRPVASMRRTWQTPGRLVESDLHGIHLPQDVQFLRTVWDEWVSQNPENASLEVGSRSGGPRDQARVKHRLARAMLLPSDAPYRIPGVGFAMTRAAVASIPRSALARRRGFVQSRADEGPHAGVERRRKDLLTGA